MVCNGAYAQSDQSQCKSLGYSMSVQLLTEHHLEVLSLKGGCTRLVSVYTCQYATLLEITLVQYKTRMTWNLILKFFSLLILVVGALHSMNPSDATLASLSVLKYSRWRLRWPSVRLLRPI